MEDFEKIKQWAHDDATDQILIYGHNIDIALTDCSRADYDQILRHLGALITCKRDHQQEHIDIIHKMFARILDYKIIEKRDELIASGRY